MTGVSGSGKSSLIEDVLYTSLARTLHRAGDIPGAHDDIRGVELINKVIRVDQQPLGNTPTSNPATYTGVFDLIRQLFAQLPEAKVRGYTPRRFSFNVPGGRCEECEGNGQKRIEMHFLPDVWVECDTCRGQPLQSRNAGRPLSRPVDRRRAGHVVRQGGEAVREHPQDSPHFANAVRRGARLPDARPAGAHAFRRRGPAREAGRRAARPDTGRTLYLLDEPTTGLHFDDLAKLLDVLNRLVDLGNTVVVIEHNLDVIKTADWMIDMGPEAGDDGGHVVAAGTPEDVVEGRIPKAEGGRRKADKQSPLRLARASSPGGASPVCISHTAAALAPVLAAGPLRRTQAPRLRRRARPNCRRSRHRRSRQANQNAVGSRRPPLAHGRSRGPQRRTLPLGRPHPGRIVDRIHELGQFSPTELERSQRGRNRCRAKKPTAGSSTPSPARNGC